MRHAGAAGVALRPGHRLQLPGAGPEAVEAFPRGDDFAHQIAVWPGRALSSNAPLLLIVVRRTNTGTITMSLADSYLETTRDVYRRAALEPQQGLCCTTSPVWQLPELNIPCQMLSMNYGCGSTVHPRDLGGSPSVLYVGVGGGMEVLQFAYFSRRDGAVIGLDVVDEMLAACRENLVAAETLNPGSAATSSICARVTRSICRLPTPRSTLPRRTACSTSSTTGNWSARCRKCTACSSRTAKLAAQRPGLRLRNPGQASQRREAACHVPHRRPAACGLHQAADRYRLRHHRGSRATAVSRAVAAPLRNRQADRRRKRRDLRDQGPGAE